MLGVWFLLGSCAMQKSIVQVNIKVQNGSGINHRGDIYATHGLGPVA